MDSSHSPRLIGYVPYVNPPPSFALPVFELGFNSYAIQVVDPGACAEFIPFTLVGDPLILLEPARRLEQTVSQVLVFIDINAVHIGTAAELARILRRFARSNPDDLALNLQIAELIGSADERRVARLRMGRALGQEEATDVAERFNQSSSAYESFWRALCESHRDDDAMGVLRGMRRALSKRFDVEKPELVDEDVWEALSPLLSKHVGDVIREVRAAIPDPASYITPDNPYDVTQDIKPSNRLLYDEAEVDSTLQIAQTRPRQEERIAVLMEALMSNKRAGMQALRRFQPRRKFERIAQQHLLEIMTETFIIKMDDELTLAKAAQKLYALWFPLQRGLLLVELARHLGKYPRIADAIEKKAKASRAFSVVPYVPEIERHLTRDASRR